MARIWTCGFETGGFEHNGPRSAGVSVVATPLRTGRYSCRLPYYVDQTFIQHIFGADYTEIYFRTAIRTAGLALDFDVIQFRDINGVALCKLTHSWANQLLSVRDGACEGQPTHPYPDEGNVLGQGSIVIAVGVWYVIEGHVVFNASTGSFTVKVNSVTDISATNCNTGSGMRSVTFCNARGGLGTNDLVWIDDVAINDPAGSYQNSWIGLGGVFLLKPNAEGVEQDFTPSAGTEHFSLVDDTPNDTTTWVQSGVTAGERELYDVEDCPEYVTDVDLVEVLWKTAVVESGSNSLKGIVRQDPTNYPDAAGQVIVSIAPDYVFYKGDTHYVQPNGSGAWTDTAIDAVQVGIEVA